MAQSPIGQLVPISGIDPWRGHYEHQAFVPDALPERLEALNPDLAVSG
jgi:hypothetical protein